MRLDEFCGAEIFMFARIKRLTGRLALRLNSDTSSGGRKGVRTCQVRRRKEAIIAVPNMRRPRRGFVQPKATGVLSLVAGKFG